MSNPFFDHPNLNSTYDYPKRRWELDSKGQATQQIIEHWRRAECEFNKMIAQATQP